MGFLVIFFSKPLMSHGTEDSNIEGFRRNEILASFALLKQYFLFFMTFI